jgi:hypothetical protein
MVAAEGMGNGGGDVFEHGFVVAAVEVLKTLQGQSFDEGVVHGLIR